MICNPRLHGRGDPQRSVKLAEAVEPEVQRNHGAAIFHEKVYRRGTPNGILLYAREYNMKLARKHGTPPSVATAASRKVVVDFPAPLFRETERVVAEIGTSRSKLIRRAVEHYLEALQRKRLEQELAAGYAANSALDRRIAEEFSAVDYEAF